MTIQEYIEKTGESPLDRLGEDWELILEEEETEIPPLSQKQTAKLFR